MTDQNQDQDNSIYMSVIIPAYNEQNRIADTLYRLKDYLDEQDYKAEIIVVDDGSTDLTTEIVKFIDIYGAEMKQQETGVLMENVKNAGKGFSVARGMIRAQGEIIMFCDADMATPIEEIEKLLPYFDDGYDVIIGSRGVGDSVVTEKSFFRKVLSWGLNMMVRVMSVPNIKDTQCGFKAYSRDAANNIAMRQRIYGFGFDIEHLFVAYKLGYKLKEVGIRWEDQDGSTVDPVKDSIQMFVDLFKIRLMHWRLKKLSEQNNS